jgi:hypothetical protein
MARRIWGEPSDLEDRSEALSYRQAALGLFGGTAFLVVFLVWAGLSPLVAVAAFAIYFALSLAVARIRAELGPPVHDLHFSGPDHVLTRSLGTPAFSSRDLTVLSFFYWFNRAYRSHPMPFGIEGLKAARDTGGSQKVMFWATMLAALIGTVAVFWAYLHLAYTLGAQARMRGGAGFAGEAYNRLNGWLQSPTPPNALANGAMGVGFAFCSLLMLARIKFPWWPVPPHRLRHLGLLEHEPGLGAALDRLGRQGRPDALRGRAPVPAGDALLPGPDPGAGAGRLGLAPARTGAGHRALFVLGRLRSDRMPEPAAARVITGGTRVRRDRRHRRRGGWYNQAVLADHRLAEKAQAVAPTMRVCRRTPIDRADQAGLFMAAARRKEATATVRPARRSP